MAIKLLRLAAVSLLFLAAGFSADIPRIEDMKGKTILLFTPHPDDDAFCCGGTLALLTRNGNKVYVVLYTNDDKGSYDPDMTSERLARIRKSEEEAGNRIVGVAPDHLIWLGHHDGMLEYVDSKALVEQATAVIRKYRPDVVMMPDPGPDYVRWHKTDHRMAAMNTLDAVRAAEWHLYFPNQKLQQGLEPWRVPELLFFYVLEKDANVWVNIDPVMDKKLDASLCHVSQFEQGVHKYRPDWRAEDRKKAADEVLSMLRKRDGHYVESFRWATDFNQY